MQPKTDWAHRWIDSSQLPLILHIRMATESWIGQCMCTPAVWRGQPRHLLSNAVVWSQTVVWTWTFQNQTYGLVQGSWYLRTRLMVQLSVQVSGLYWKTCSNAFKPLNLTEILIYLQVSNSLWLWLPCLDQSRSATQISHISVSISMLRLEWISHIGVTGPVQPWAGCHFCLHPSSFPCPYVHWHLVLASHLPPHCLHNHLNSSPKKTASKSPHLLSLTLLPSPPSHQHCTLDHWCKVSANELHYLWPHQS